VWKRQRSALRGLPALGAALLAAACAREAPRSAVLISIDTLRADHLGVYGHARPTSPHLDAFAAGGVVFEDARSTAAWALPAHASMLTGLTPARHGGRTFRHFLPSELPTLATLLHARGFATAGFVNSGFLKPRFGIARGFGTYALFREDDSPEGAAPRITQRALAWLEEHRDRPFFLFLHYFDVHSDYSAVPRIRQEFAPEPGRLTGTTAELMRIRGSGGPVDAADAERLARLCDAGIRQLDEGLAPLLAWLETSGALEQTMVVVTADHGEEFGEHGSVGHDRTHYRELLHVPLVLRGAGLPAGVRVAEPVSLTDLAPTLLRLLGVEPPPDLDGRDLAPLWRSPAGPAAPRPLFAETSPQAEDALRSVRLGPLELIRDRRTGRAELYDLASDPGETRDFSAERPEDAAHPGALLDALEAGAREPAVHGEDDPELEAQLRALGYLGAGSAL
jgi:arylsulfatase A-like enzyme